MMYPLRVRPSLSLSSFFASREERKSISRHCMMIIMKSEVRKTRAAAGWLQKGNCGKEWMEIRKIIMMMSSQTIGIIWSLFHILFPLASRNKHNHTNDDASPDRRRISLPFTSSLIFNHLLGKGAQKTVAYSTLGIDGWDSDELRWCEVIQGWE